MNKKFSVSEVLPHEKPMILIDAIIDYSESHLTAVVEIKKDTLFVSDEAGVPAWIGVEYMAQSIAAFAGVRDLLKDEPIRVGYLVGTKKYESQIPVFPVGSRLRVNVQEQYQGSDIGLFQCQIEIDQQVQVEAVLTVHHPKHHTETD